MLVSDVITRVRATAGDINALQFTDPQIISWINDGVRECALTNNLLQKTATSDVSGQASVVLPTDILKLHSVKINDTRIRVMTMEEFDNLYGGTPSPNESGTPYACYVWAGSLVLYPKAQPGTSLTINYLYNPETVGNNEDTIPLPVGYDIRVVDYCLAQIAQQDEDYTRYNIKMQEFRTGVQELKDQPENTYDLYPSMSVSPRDMDGYYYD